MSSITIADLPRISREDLSRAILSSPPSSSSLAVVDVRDSDYIGGHIAGSTNVPSNTLDYRTPELVRTLKDKETVVFHCALSQQRGPSAALRYLRERKRLLAVGNEEEEGTGVGKEGQGGESKNGTAGGEQKVYVLEGGFNQWQEKCVGAVTWNGAVC